MKSCRTEREPSELERSIESKRTLVAYLRSRPKHLTIESFICIADLLQKSGWNLEGERWRKGDLWISLVEAAIVEMTAQISAEKDRLLRKTVKGYPGKAEQFKTFS